MKWRDRNSNRTVIREHQKKLSKVCKMVLRLPIFLEKKLSSNRRPHRI